MKPPRNRAADFETFKTACEHWRQWFGLLDWRLVFQRKPAEGDDGRMATVYLNGTARVAMLVLWEGLERSIPLERIALHEMLHVLVNDCIEIAGKRATALHDDVFLEEHRLIERLMSVLE